MRPPARRPFRQSLADCPVVPIKQAVWRGHRRHYEALDHAGSLLGSGRFHRAANEYPSDQSWPALYTALDLAVALGEVQRNTHGKRWHEYRFTEIWTQLEVVFDCREMHLLGIAEDDLLNNLDYSTGQALAAVA